MKLQFSTRQLFIAIGIFAIALAALIPGWRLQQSPGKTNEVESLSWMLILLGLFLMGVAVGSLSGRLKTAFWFGMATPAVAYLGFYAYLAVCYWLGIQL